VYRPPSANINEFLLEFDNLLVCLAAEHPTISNWMIAGDFNINLLEPVHYTDDFMDVLISHCIFPTIFIPTRPKSGSLLDNLFFSWPSVCDSYVFEMDISDHYPILARIRTGSVIIPDIKPNLKRFFTQSNIDSFRCRLADCNWDAVLLGTDTDVVYDAFATLVGAAYETSFPLVQCSSAVTVYKNAWFTKGLLISSRKRSQMYRDFHKGKISKDYYNKYRNMYVDLLRKAKAAYYCKLFDCNKRNVKVVWEHIRSIRSENKTVLRISNVEELNNFYVDLGPSTVAGVYGDGKYGDSVPFNDHTFVLHETTYDEIIDTCLALNDKSSSGIDGISTKLLQNVIKQIVRPLLHIFNLSFKNGVFPKGLKVAKVVPIFKGGDLSQLVNYRPISILPSVSKILEKIMYNRMISFTNKYALLSSAQYGFRAGRSTQDAIADLVEHVTMNLDEHADVSALFVDVAKAFDSVNHTILLHKLYKYGFRGVVANWLFSYLNGRMQYVEVDGCKSLLRMLRTGVPQGSILGPLFFLFYVNDLPNSCPNAHFILFADDTTVLVPLDDLAETCSNMYKWFQTNRLVLNVAKTKCMLFTLKNINPPVVSLAGTQVELVKSIKFLGCVVDERLLWSEHIAYVCKKMSQGLAMLRCVYKLFPVWVKKLIYFAYVYPFMCYCVSIWGNAAHVHISRVIVLQKKSIRLMLGLHPLDHVKPHAKSHKLLLFSEKRNCSLAIFAYRNFAFGENRNLFVSGNFNLLSSLNNIVTRCTDSCNYFLPFVRTSFRKKSVVYRSVIVWNQLSPNVKCLSNVNIVKKHLTNFYVASY
jgi:hypothetical protein